MSNELKELFNVNSVVVVWAIKAENVNTKVYHLSIQRNVFTQEHVNDDAYVDYFTVNYYKKSSIRGIKDHSFYHKFNKAKT